jgi:hypothetical protein
MLDRVPQPQWARKFSALPGKLSPRSNLRLSETETMTSGETQCRLEMVLNLRLRDHAIV